MLIGSISVRVRRDANEQMVLAHVTNRLAPLVSQLTVQVGRSNYIVVVVAYYFDNQISFYSMGPYMDLHLSFIRLSMLEFGEEMSITFYLLGIVYL